MDLLKRIGFVVLSVLSVLMVFQADAMLTDRKTYAKSSKRFNGFQGSPKPKERGLEFQRVVYDADKENKPSEKRKAEDAPESSPVKRQKKDYLDSLDQQLKSADHLVFQEVITTPALENKERYNQYRRECKASGEDDLFFANLYASDVRSLLAKRAELVKITQIEQEEKDKRYEQDRLNAIAETKKRNDERARLKQLKMKQKELNQSPVKIPNSKYAQNLMNISGGRTSGDPCTNLFMHIAEGDYDAAIRTIQWNNFSDNPNALALMSIGTKDGTAENPKELYEMLHAHVSKIGPDFPEENLDACALHFAKKAENEKYLAFAETINK